MLVLTIRFESLNCARERTVSAKPPRKLTKHEAPWRMTFGLHRHSLEPFEPTPWIHWESMSNRQMCSSAPPSRILISVFARQVGNQGEVSNQSNDAEANLNPRRHELESSMDMQNKRFRSEHDSPDVPFTCTAQSANIRKRLSNQVMCPVLIRHAIEISNNWPSPQHNMVPSISASSQQLDNGYPRFTII